MRFRLQSSKREIKMLNRLLKVKLGYPNGDSVFSFNMMAKVINQSIPGEKFNLVENEDQLIEAMNKLAASLNGRKMLKMNLKYTSNKNSIVGNLKWAIKVLNSSTRK